MWNCRDPSQDDRKLISEFLDAYYGKAAPFVRLYMDTMHGSISDTNFWMGEGFPLDAAFLTPIALLTSATAFVDGRATVTGLELERLNRAAMAVYYPILMRWAELRSFAQAESMHWPLEPTIEGAFDAFASAFNATTAAYCGDSAHCVAPAFREGATGSSLLLQLQRGGPGNMGIPQTLEPSHLRMPCQSNWDAPGGIGRPLVGACISSPHRDRSDAPARGRSLGGE